MDLFEPPKKVLEMICENEESPLTQYEVYPFGSVKEMYELQTQYCSGIFEKIINFYKEEGIALNEESKKRLNRQGIYNVAGEIFKNWADHSPEDSNLETGLFLGSKGVCYGFYDGGEFFKDSKIKNQLENKILFEEFNENPRSSCARSGFNPHIFPCSDYIEVDSEKGVLYAVQLKENLIAPEGESGSRYFYNLKKEKELFVNEPNREKSF